MNERSCRLLMCAEQFRRERQRGAGTSGYSKKFATIDHDRLRSVTPGFCVNVSSVCDGEDAQPDKCGESRNSRANEP